MATSVGLSSPARLAVFTLIIAVSSALLQLFGPILLPAATAWLGLAAGDEHAGAASLQHLRILTRTTTLAELQAGQGGAGLKPALVNGTDVASWPATQLWTVDYVAQHLPAEPLDGIKASVDGVFTYFDKKQRWAPFFSPAFVALPAIPVACVLHYNCPEVGNATLYATLRVGQLGDHLAKQLGNISNLAVVPAFLNVNVWLGSAGATAAPHYDVEHNLFVQLAGRKKFILFPPLQYAQLYLHPALHPSWRQSQFRSVPPTSETGPWPLFHEAKAVQVDLGPGDVLYVPPYWFHMVIAQTESVSLNVWSESEEYAIMQDIASFELPIDPERSPDFNVVVARAYVHAVLNAIFASDGGAHGMLTHLLQSRYVRWLAWNATNEEYDLAASAPQSVWLQFRESATAANVAKQLQNTASPLRAKVHDSAVGVSRLLAALPAGTRHIIGLDHVEEVAAFVVRNALQFTKRGTPEAVEEPDPRQVFVFIRDGLL